MKIKWSQAGSNRRPPACKAGALPAELWPQRKWWAWVDLNYWPHAYQACALTNWATGPSSKSSQLFSLKAVCVGLRQSHYNFIKEVIQPQVPLRLPCYDFTPVMKHTVVIALLAVRLTTSGAIHSHGVTGGVYKARERIHRDVLIRDY